MDIILIMLTVAILLWLLYEWYEHTAVKYTTTVVESNKLKGDVRICLISDLHNNRKNYSNIVERIKSNHSEVILIAGDMVDKHKEKNEHALAMLYELKKAAPVFYSPGNHESSMSEKSPDAWRQYLLSLPEEVCYLDNDICRLSQEKEIFISGLTLPKCYYKKGALYEQRDELPEIPLPKQGFHIMLAHNPEYIHFYDKYHADFIVSGHLHGGLMRLPWIGGLVSPRLRIPGRDAGLIPLDNGSHLFISKGLGSHTIPLRFFNRVEINFIILKGTKETE